MANGGKKSGLSSKYRLANLTKKCKQKHEETKMEKTFLFQGAESKIYLENVSGTTTLVKERFNKKYRIPALHSSLTKERMKAECKNMVRCQDAGIRTPKIYKTDMDNHKIYMEYLKDAVTAKDYINKIEKEKGTEELDDQLRVLSEKIGQTIAKMHLAGIVHGDLTTSNMLLLQDELVLIDFGLSSGGGNAQEKGVDLYVLERGLISTHATAERLFSSFLAAYELAMGKPGVNVLSKYREVRARGRKRTMVG